MADLHAALETVSGAIWGWPMVILLFGTHVLLTVRLRFIQRYVGRAIRISLGRRREGEGDVSQFGALTTALAATIGTGNIVGVATAIALGGPGAVFWMWISGVFGIATKYSEALLSVKYRIRTEDGLMAGGPMYVIERGMGWKWLGVVFASLTTVAGFGIGNMVQANSISTMVSDVYSVPTAVSGLVLAVLTAIVIIGGITSIARVCERLVPVMAFTYVGGCAVLLVMGIDQLPATVGLIMSSAFSGQAALGGFAGTTIKEAIRFGVARGLFSNESGLGSAPIVAAAAQTANPVRQALVSSTGTFWDTVVVCAITGLTVVNSGEWMAGLSGAQLTRAAFDRFPVFGPFILSLGLLTFVFSTILGWAYYGEKAAEYLFGKRVIVPYRWLWVAFVFVGSVLSLPVVWTFADIANACMALPNLISLIALGGVVVSETKKYLWDADRRTGG